MKVRFKGEADGLPCHVFGQEFPAGKWVPVVGIAALKLATNPMFEADGKPAKAEPGPNPAAAAEPEPDPEAVEDLSAQG